jgi:2-C-methyl-D-erythritol 4-phosphate cytidylyltransferase
MKRFVLIVAGGKGMRMGGELPKQFIPFNGKPVLMHTLEAFYRWDNRLSVYLALPAAHQDYWKMLCEELGCTVPHTVVDGGETRFHSVQSGLRRIRTAIKSCSPEQFLIGVHDGVRPFVSAGTMARCFHEAAEAAAVLPVVPLIDSLRELDGKGGSHPVDREQYASVQTPQVFRGDVLLGAYEQPYDAKFTDDASVVESYGTPVRTVEGNRENIKITTPFDLLMAKALFAQPEYR